MLKRIFFVILALTVTGMVPIPASCQQENTATEPDLETSATAEIEILTFDVLVTDADGTPVANATVKPWAMKSAHGHGLWNDESLSGVAPKTAQTNENGKATVSYPKLADPEEQLKATAISVTVEHPDHPILGNVHIEVPTAEPYQAKLPAGAALEVELTLDGERATGDDIRAVWTGGRPIKASGLEYTEEGIARIPPMPIGSGQLMFVKLDGKIPTHFSKIEKFEITEASKVVRKKLDLLPAVRLTGRLDSNVPRPVKDGRINIQSISIGNSWDEVSWSDWAKVQPDGSFVIEAWPKDMPLQLTALCDGFMAKSGKNPDQKAAAERVPNGFFRPQAFVDPESAELIVEMTALQTCQIEVKNAFDKKLENVTAAANPNVRWWNGGSSIYCHPLASSGEYLRSAKYDLSDENGPFPPPFRATSDETGTLSFQLPVGKTLLWVGNKRWQLPAVLGRRMTTIDVESNQPLKLKLVLQPKGLDILGDWEDLCGLVFG